MALLMFTLLFLILFVTELIKSETYTVFKYNEDNIPCIRIPGIIMATNGTLLAFAECRHWIGDGCVPNNYNNIDGSPTYVCMKSSNDNGVTWSNISYPVSNSISNSQPTVLYDKINKQVLLQVLMNSSVYQIISKDNGKTWNNLMNIGKLYLNEYANTDIGPGRGLQLYNNDKYYGRILFVGHHGAYQEDIVWYSDDYGLTYNLSETILYKMDEAQMFELNNGSIIVNMRNNYYFNNTNNINYRALSLSNNGGLSFNNIIPDTTLISPVCMASTINYNNKYYFSNPNNDKNRINMTVKVSIDGYNYNVLQNIYSGQSAYSCLTTVNINDYIGLLYERDAQGCVGPSCQIVFTLVKV